MKIEKQINQSYEIELDFPFYSYYQDDDQERYYKISKDSIYLIIITFNDFMISKTDHNNKINEDILKNKCSEEKYNEGKECLSEYITIF